MNAMHRGNHKIIDSLSIDLSLVAGQILQDQLLGVFRPPVYADPAKEPAYWEKMKGIFGFIGIQ
jgi:hypothetical protein